MSYYRPSFSQTVAMTRGRGGYSSSRGSSYHRGSSSRGGSSWGGRGFSSSRGGGYSSSFNHYDSRSKYSSSSDRYSGSRGHSDDYRKSYRSDGYSGRDDNHRSPDRKRLRTEASSSRHDSGGGYDSYSSSRYDSSSSYPSRRSYSDDRRVGGGSSFSRRGDDFRKPLGPPSSTPRGSYRGRISSRGSRGFRARDRPIIRRRLVDSSYTIHKRVVSSRSADYARRLKLARLRSAAFRRTSKRRSDKDDSDEDKDDDDDDEVEPNWDKETPAEKEDKQQNGDVKTEKDDENKDKDKDKEKDKDKDDSTSSIKKEVKKEDASDKEDKNKSDSESGDKSFKRKHIELLCIHCGRKSLTFAKYKLHLSSVKHIAAMRRVAIRQKGILGQMRLSQRNAQRELEKTTEDLAPRTNFCPLCKLNYKQPKLTHQNSESHKNMKKFLMPYCRVCKVTFKSPMLYENHLCSLEHIKRKSRLDITIKSDKEESANDDDNLENFMTIDSVGDVDDEDGAKKDGKEVDTKDQVTVGIEQIRKVEVYYCDLCRMYLPRVDESEVQRILAKHCKLRSHMQQYVRYKEDKDLAKHAERLQRKENEERVKGVKKEKDVKGEKEATEGETKEKAKPEEEKEKPSGAEDEDGGDDKMWADVDKDLGDILAEAESGNKSSDEDEDSRADGERYDRFRTAEEKRKAAAEGEEAADEQKGDVVVEKKEEKVEEQ